MLEYFPLFKIFPYFKIVIFVCSDYEYAIFHKVFFFSKWYCSYFGKVKVIYINWDNILIKYFLNYYNVQSDYKILIWNSGGKDYITLLLLFARGYSCKYFPDLSLLIQFPKKELYMSVWRWEEKLDDNPITKRSAATYSKLGCLTYRSIKLEQ